MGLRSNNTVESPLTFQKLKSGSVDGPEWPSTEMTTVYLYLFDGLNLSLLETTALEFWLALFPKKIDKKRVTSSCYCTWVLSLWLILVSHLCNQFQISLIPSSVFSDQDDLMGRMVQTLITEAPSDWTHVLLKETLQDL